MQFIDENNDPDFWSRDHYADETDEEEQPPLQNPAPPAFIKLGNRLIFPKLVKDEDGYDHQDNTSRLFHHAHSPRLSVTPRPDDIFPQNSLIVLAGQPKIGKTTIALALAKAIATGKPFAGQKTIKQPVGYISFDDSIRELKHAIDKHNDITPDTPLFIATDLNPIDTKSGRMQIEDFLQNNMNATVIIDSFHAAIDKSRTNDARAIRKLFNPLKRISERAGRIIIIHHTNAYGTRIADHTQLQASVSQTILMTYQQKEHCRLIKWQSLGRGANATQTLHIASPNETTFKPHSLDPLESLDPRDKSTKPILKAIQDRALTVREIQTQTKLPTRRIQKRLRHLLLLGSVRARIQPGAPTQYALATAPHAPQKNAKTVNN